MCTSLEQGYSYYCLQEVCSVFSVFKQFIGNSISGRFPPGDLQALLCSPSGVGQALSPG